MNARVSLCCLTVASLSSPGLLAAATPSFPAHTLANTELRVLPATPQGRRYQLHVGFPSSYSRETTKRYPVVFVTDAYWDFPTIQGAEGALVYDRVAPEFITVGLGYAGENLDYDALRRWELSPVALDDGGAAPSGHAAEFLETLARVLIPFVDREYRTDTSYRVLAGSSLGGLFTLYAMYTKPALFQAYIAPSPAVVAGHDWLFRYEEDFAKRGEPLPARLYLTGAENEWPAFLAGIHRFHDQISAHRYEGFVCQFRQIDGERHAGTKPEAYVRGLRFAFEPRAPETGRMHD